MLRVGIVGVGRGAHVRACATRAVPRLDPGAFCSRSPARVAAVASTLQDPRLAASTITVVGPRSSAEAGGLPVDRREGVA